MHPPKMDPSKMDPSNLVSVAQAAQAAAGPGISCAFSDDEHEG